jgi:hypothetical protein
MKIYTLTRKGSEHLIYCEDFLWVDTTHNERFNIFVVADGCSSGKDSHFASAFLCKLLKSSFLELKNEHQYLDNSLQFLTILLEIFWEKLKKIQEILNLEENELLSTLGIFIYDKAKKEGKILFAGDGYVKIDENIFEIDENNEPMYVGYHFFENKNVHQTFFMGKTHIFEVKNPKDISIATDGILTFRTWKPDKVPENFSVIDYLTENRELENQPAMLVRKYNILDKKYGFLPADDISLIRIIF